MESEGRRNRSPISHSSAVFGTKNYEERKLEEVQKECTYRAFEDKTVKEKFADNIASTTEKKYKKSRTYNKVL